MEVVVPDLGDFSDVEIIEVLVKPGDDVHPEDPLVTLETDKATMDIPSPASGKIGELKVGVGDRVSTGDLLLLLEQRAGHDEGDGADRDAAAQAETGTDATETGGTAEARERGGAATGEAEAREETAELGDEHDRATPEEAAPESAAPSAPPAAASPRASAIDEAGFAFAHASPSVRKLARELGVDLARVRGSGRKGRVTADDVKAYVKEVMRGGGAGAGQALPAVPRVDFAKYGRIEVEPLTRIQRISGPRLHASWVNVPHVTQHDEADITELEQTRSSLKETAQKRGIKLTPLAFVIRACVLTLADFPLFKSSLSSDGQSLVVKHYTHIGFAADTDKGLVVPVIRDADKKDIYELALALASLSARAREGKLQADDIQGAVFTVSSLGGIGGRFFTPIINAPEVAILGVSRSAWRPVYRERERGEENERGRSERAAPDLELVPRLILPLSLAYDHRVIDGANAVRFTTRLGEKLGDVTRLVEAIP